MAPGGESGRWTGRFGDVRHVEETDSTNEDVTTLARAGAPEGIVVVADHQRAGRGRRGRTWMAPPGSALLVSVLVRPGLAPSAAPLVGMAAALAAVEACPATAGVDAVGVTLALKWPNDVVTESSAGTAKLAGILAESLIEGDRLTAVVVGMGCNLRRAIVEDRGGSAITILHNARAPVSPAYLEDLAGRPVDRDDLLHTWLTRLDQWCTTLEAPGGRHLVTEAYRRRCTTLGRPVRVELADGHLEGGAVDVTDEGHLVVECGAVRHTVTAGDAVHLRPSA
jgi:BirA family biotin operon repressor/biotin-[acetyl-CoA-carboxylase] ligase